MQEIFSRDITDDSRLRARFAVTHNGNDFLDSITLPINKAVIYGEPNNMFSTAFYMHTDLAETAQRLYDEKNNTQAPSGDYLGIRVTLFFDNDETFYDFYYPLNMCIQYGAPRGAILHTSIPARNVALTRNGIGNDPFLPLTTLQSNELPHEEAIQIVMDCLKIQEQNPPLPLSPMERMRRNAANRFAAPKPNIGAQEPPTAMQQTATTGAPIFDPSILTIREGSLDPEKDLQKIVGLESVKREFIKMEAALNMQKERAARLNLSSATHSGHMCFMGAPGTGKTTVARIVAGILYKAGMIQKNQCVEVAGLDLLGNYVGQTTPRTQAIIEHAAGGVLFIDEAYAITTSTYGKEAVGVLLKEMEDNRSGLVVILAGYEKDMQQLLNLNEGFTSRINRYFHFENYNEAELAKLMMFNLKSHNLMIDGPTLEKCLSCFSRDRHAPTFSNGRYIRNFVEKLESRHILNYAQGLHDESINIIKLIDLPQEVQN